MDQSTFKKALLAASATGKLPLSASAIDDYTITGPREINFGFDWSYLLAWSDEKGQLRRFAVYFRKGADEDQVKRALIQQYQETIT